MNIYDIISESLQSDDIIMTEEELLNESVFFKVSPFIAFTAFKKKAFDSLNKSKSFLKAKDLADKTSPVTNLSKAQIAVEKLKSKTGAKGSDKNETVYKFLPQQKEVLADIYNKYGKELVAEIQDFRDNILAPYQLIKRTIKKNRMLSSKEIHGMSKDEFLSARESGRKKIEKRASMFEDLKNIEEKMDEANESYNKAKKVYEDFKNNSTKEISNDTLEKMFKIYGLGQDSLQGYSLDELKKTYDAIVRNKELLERKIKYDDEDKRTDVLKILRDNRILREKGVSFIEEKKKKTEDKKKKEDEEETVKKGSFSVAFTNYMLRKNIRDSFKDTMGNSIYKAMYLSILKENIQNIASKKEDILASYIKIKKNVEFTPNEEKIWGKIPTNLQKYSGDIKDYYQKLRDEDFKNPIYFEKPAEVVKAENEIENEIKRFERKLAKTVEPEDLAKLKKYRLINNLIIVSELKDPSSLFKTREEILSTSNKNTSKNEYMDEDEYVRKLKHLTSIKYDTFQELNDAKNEIKELSKSVDKDISEKYKDIVDQFLMKRSLKSEKIIGHKYENAGDVIDINDIENFVNKILKKEYDDIDLMKQDKMQLDSMIDQFKKEDPNAEKEMSEIKMLLSQIDRKLQGMTIKVIGKGEEETGDDDDDDEEEDKYDGLNEPSKKEQ